MDRKGAASAFYDIINITSLPWYNIDLKNIKRAMSTVCKIFNQLPKRWCNGITQKLIIQSLQKKAGVMKVDVSWKWHLYLILLKLCARLSPLMIN